MLRNRELIGLAEARAGRIDDPVEKLRLLQLSTRVVRSRRPVLPSLGVAALLCGALAPFPAPNSVTRPPAITVPDRVPPVVMQPVWQVDTGHGFELYSNGLRIETDFEAPSRPRGGYFAYGRDADGFGIVREARCRFLQPAGIVFHQTESLQAPFKATENRRLTRIELSLLDFVRRKHCYHYLIDRFGRVWRIVPEPDVADHAGYSVWADEHTVYVNLNSAFLGVAVESAGSAAPSEPQVHSLRVLVQWLRYRYGIPGSNCIAHAQVSVNPRNMRIGYHSDWASGFPYAAAGLPDNYRAPVPALCLFGFQTDASLVKASGGQRWPGIGLAEGQMHQWAALSGLSERQFRRRLQEQYRAIGHGLAAEEREQNDSE